MRISVIVTPEEHAKIKKAAGLAPLSAWMKHVALCECNGEFLVDASKDVKSTATRKSRARFDGSNPSPPTRLWRKRKP